MERTTAQGPAQSPQDMVLLMSFVLLTVFVWGWEGRRERNLVLEG